MCFRRWRPLLASGADGNEGADSIRIDRDVLQAFKATGPGWQTRMNEALAEATRKFRAA